MSSALSNKYIPCRFKCRAVSYLRDINKKKNIYISLVYIQICNKCLNKGRTKNCNCHKLLISVLKNYENDMRDVINGYFF